MLVKAYCAAVNGLEVTTVTVEVSLNKGVMYHLTGLGDEAGKAVTVLRQPCNIAASDSQLQILPSIWHQQISERKEAALTYHWQ